MTSWVRESQAPVPWFKSVWFSFCEKTKKIPWSLWFSESLPDSWLGESEESKPLALPRGWHCGFLVCAAGFEHLQTRVTLSFSPGRPVLTGGAALPSSHLHGLPSACVAGWGWEGLKEEQTRRHFVRGAASKNHVPQTFIC